jgi:peptide-methionine (S)-S-oxide reductase
MESIVLGGGCFWCTEAVFQNVKGVTALESGYCNGHVPNPTYAQVCEGTTGHAEVIKVTFDPEVVSLEILLNIFFATHDPTTLNRQGNDVGTQYRSGIYTQSDTQAAIASHLKQNLDDSGTWSAKMVTEIVPLANYTSAERYHQRYFELNPAQGYCAYIIAPKVAKFRSKYAKYLAN